MLLGQTDHLVFYPPPHFFTHTNKHKHTHAFLIICIQESRSLQTSLSAMIYHLELTPNAPSVSINTYPASLYPITRTLNYTCVLNSYRMPHVMAW
jgi:hypothetical protein